jgi:hypothetical protein
MISLLLTPKLQPKQTDGILKQSPMEVDHANSGNVLSDTAGKPELLREWTGELSVVRAVPIVQATKYLSDSTTYQPHIPTLHPKHTNGILD